MWSRVELKEKAKIALKQNYWKIVLVCVILVLVGGSGDPTVKLNYETSTPYYEGTSDIYMNDAALFYDGMPQLYNMGFLTGLSIYIMVAVVIALIVGFAIAAFLLNPIALGANRFLVKSLNEPAELEEIFYAFNNNYKNIVKVLFFRDLYTLLWTFLFIVPGIIKAYEYFMVPYLLTENPNLTKEEALGMSKEMMYGHKWDTFVLQLSFFGWDLLAAFTFGLLHIFYVTPYRNLTEAALFEKLNAANGYPARRANGYGYQHTYTTDEI